MEYIHILQLELVPVEETDPDTWKFYELSEKILTELYCNTSNISTITSKDTHFKGKYSTANFTDNKGNNHSIIISIYNKNLPNKFKNSDYRVKYSYFDDKKTTCENAGDNYSDLIINTILKEI